MSEDFAKSNYSIVCTMCKQSLFNYTSLLKEMLIEARTLRKRKSAMTGPGK